ncbi:hypothetical protein KC318_g10931 [Hortaea werneckii]|nr:hypothetical protein KC334_g8534 [Hortaea werneckii]KAI7024955.1 hypothetical protein KC355_g1247 [Hortaea werneckii]KAI7658946.1 hypothetical protein KC318_g10931 [Hortaea werneckii]
MPAVNEHKARRVLTRNACMRCRARKAKCNGKRPSCRSCLAKGLNCVYDTACEDITKMQSLQSQLADMEKQLSSKTADLDSCMALIRQFQQATEGESDDLLARLRAGENVEEPSDARGSSEEPSSTTFLKAIPKGRLPPTPESLEDVSDVQTTHQKRRRSYSYPSVRFATPPEDDFLERASSAINIPRKRQLSFSSALEVAREPSITQICPFGSHLSIMQWDSSLAAQFDACLHAGISALGPAYRAKGKYLLSTPAVDITSDGLLYQVSGLLAVTSSNHQRRHFQTWPMLNWTRYNVLGALRTALSKSNGGNDILAFIVAVLTGWERMHGDPAAFQVHLSALQKMTIEHGAKTSSEPLPNTSLVRSPSISAAERLPDGFGHLHVLGLLPNALLVLIARLTSTCLHEQEDINEWRRVSILLVALKPTSQPAVDALVNGELGLKVTECVRISAMMFITLVLAVTDNDHWNQPMLSAIEPTYSDTHPIITEDLTGSVYDEILLWTLCVFYALAGRLVARQLTCFRRLLRAFMIPTETRSWQTLQRLMKRFLYHPYFDRRLKEVMEREEQRARNETIYEM